MPDIRRAFMKIRAKHLNHKKLNTSLESYASLEHMMLPESNINIVSHTEKSITSLPLCTTDKSDDCSELSGTDTLLDQIFPEISKIIVDYQVTKLGYLFNCVALCCLIYFSTNHYCSVIKGMALGVISVSILFIISWNSLVERIVNLASKMHFKMADLTENKLKTDIMACKDGLYLSYDHINCKQLVYARIMDEQFIVITQSRECKTGKMYNLKNAEVYLIPECLPPNKLWSLRHPICVETTSNKKLFFYPFTKRDKQMWYSVLQSAATGNKLTSASVPIGLNDQLVIELWQNYIIHHLFDEKSLTNHWKDIIENNLQKKINLIELPFIINYIKLTVTNVGSLLPIVRHMRVPYYDSNGLWLDLDVSYDGGLVLEIETRVNLMNQRTKTGDIFSKEDNSDNEEFDISAGQDNKVDYFVDRLKSSNIFKKSTEFDIVKKSLVGVSNSSLKLKVEISSLMGILTINIPNPPTDSIWIGFKPTPNLFLSVIPMVGSKSIGKFVSKYFKRSLIKLFEKQLVLPNMVDLIVPFLSTNGVQIGKK